MCLKSYLILSYILYSGGNDRDACMISVMVFHMPINTCDWTKILSVYTANNDGDNIPP